MLAATVCCHVIALPEGPDRVQQRKGKGEVSCVWQGKVQRVKQNGMEKADEGVVS